MKKSTYILLGASLALTASLASCDKDTEGVTGITYYATLNLDGPTQIILTQGETFEEPGYSAEMLGEDVTADVQVTTNLNTDVPGLYSVNYIITNADGFSATASRTVMVTAPDDPMAGFYTTVAGTHLLTVNYSGYPLTIVGDGKGNYTIDDLFGGFYALRAGYGSSYAMQGKVTMDADNTLTLNSSIVPGWGYSIAEFSGSFDPATSTVSWEAYLAEADYTFTVIATKD